MDAQARYTEIADDLVARNADVQTTQMMGMPSLKHGGKLFAGLWHDTMAFKLTDPKQHEAALAIEGAQLFDPSGRGRPMKEWVQVPAAHAAEWSRLAELALRPSA
jgi:TfoX/Sxy family transcriptional regulator of competence genes